MAQESGRPVPLLRWCGIALVPGYVLMAVATLLHPSRETATTIIASEVGLVAAHFVYTLASLLVLLGLTNRHGPGPSCREWVNRSARLG